MNEDIKAKVCTSCVNSGYITWFPAQGSQGIGRAVIPPGMIYPVSNLIFEACECEIGKEFYTIKA